MQYQDLDLSKQRPVKRVGRGISAGQGKTAGRGTKGQNSRTGGKRRSGFEGGQTPITKRMPKLRGFKSIRPKADNIYTSQLEQFDGKKVDNFSLTEAGLLPNPFTKVKLITKGELTAKVEVSLQGASASAIEEIKKNGGSFTAIPQNSRPKTRVKPEK